MRRRRMILIAVSLLACAGLLGPTIAESAPQEDPRAQREKVRAERARVAAQIDTSKASVNEIDAALKAISDNLHTQEAALAKAEADVAQAEKDIADAEAAIARLTDEIALLRADMAQRAIGAYVNPDSEHELSILSTEDVNLATSRSFYIELRSMDDAEVADRLGGATVDLDHQREKATDARARAEAKRAEQADRTESVRQARADQQQLYASVNSTLQQQIERSVELAATDKALSEEIARQQALLAARLAEERARQEEARKAAEAEAARQAAAEEQARQQAAATPTTTAPSSGGGDDGGGGGDDGGGRDPLPPLPPPSGGGGGGGISLCNVGGITVNCAIQTSLTNMLNAARANGLVLTGGGYRDSSSQIALRKAHCGTSYYAIYQMPSSQCRPPTAPPGRSQHEIGLAIDFNNCSYRSTACYQWLAANASSFGFYNLPSEPWHWSTTGN